MQRLIEFVEVEFEILQAVLSRRIRSLVLLFSAFVVPPILLLAATSMIERVPLPGLQDDIRPMLGILGVVMMLNFLFLAIQTYLKDREAWLKS